MATKFSSSAILCIACIYFSSQAYGQTAGACAEAEITRCYLNFTHTRLHEAFMFDPRTTATFSMDKVDEVCGAMEPESPCKHSFMNCPTDDNQLASREEAYRAQRDIFCTTAKREAYENASRCIGNQPGFHNCTNALPDESPDETSWASFECARAEMMLPCIRRFSSMCLEPGIKALRTAIESTQALVGCDVSGDDTPDHEPVTSSAGMTTRGRSNDPVVSSAGPTAFSDSARTFWVAVYAVVVAASAILRY